jgi:hypothetical protein
MDYDISALKVLFKKIFPPSKCVYTIDSNGDGSADSIMIRAFNVIMPLEVPQEIELGGLNSNNFDIKKFDLSDYGKISLDDEPLTIAQDEFDIDVIKNHFLIYHNGICFTIDELLEGKFAGTLVALGDTIDIIIRINSDGIKRFTEGPHKFTFDSELIPKLDFNFELTEKNINRKFDPQNPQDL